MKKVLILSGSPRKNGNSDLLCNICESSSYDGGKTWTETQKTALPNPCTRFFIGRLSNGMLLRNLRLSTG